VVEGPVPAGRFLRALYAGGTFAYEARQVVPEAATETVAAVAGEVVLPDRDLILDLGDDAYTAGRPHPMIDPTVRAAHLRAALADPRTAVVVLDVVLGHGAGADPAGPLAAELERAGVGPAGRERAGVGPAAPERAGFERVPQGRRPPVVAFVVGTDADPQDRDEQRARLRAAGALLAPNSTDAIEFAAELLPREPSVASPGSDGHLTRTGGTV
ncbi:hypothetical protein G5C51_42160, partial [Streptomyces sp. A7024]|nr:hypothetical protein [Streptomyces coryli]